MQSVVSAIILCGGRSRRMGRDKAELPFGGETLLARVARLLTPVVDDIVVSAAAGQVIPADLCAVRDSRAGGGPVPALLDAWPAARHDLVAVVAVDTPLLQPSVLELLARSLASGDEAVVPRVRGRAMPVCALYRRPAARAAAARLPPDASLHQLLDALSVRWLDEAALATADPGLMTFLPCNTDEDYQRALALAGFDPSATFPMEPAR
jgi:molybdopterin-guanine dinucleotide biosynthesis protein A